MLGSIGCFPSNLELTRLAAIDDEVSLAKLLEMTHLQKQIGRETEDNIQAAFQVKVERVLAALEPFMSHVRPKNTILLTLG